MALPIKLTRIWMTARSSPLADSGPAPSGAIVTPCSSAEESSITTASAASAARSIECWSAAASSLIEVRTESKWRAAAAMAEPPIAVASPWATGAGASARPAPGKAAGSRKRADQRHLAAIVFFEADDAGQRLAGDAVGVDAKQLGQVRRQ